MKNKNGFTLVEVLVTITILGIVTLISLPVISAISGKLNDNKLDTYKGIIESGAKIYTDSHDIDLFGYQKNGCADIYYTTLVSEKVIDELDFSNQDVIVDKIFVRVKKINDNYDYEIFLPTDEEIASLDFNLCNGTISDAGPTIGFDPNGNDHYEKNSYTNIQIKDFLGISPNAKIKYQWFYSDGTPIGTEKNHDFRNSVVDSLNLRVDTPSGINGVIKLIVTPVDLSNEAGLETTAASQSHDFKLDTVPPVVNIDAYQESGGNRTGGVLKAANNSNIVINDWAKYGYYFDLSRSSDNVGITKETWSWNQAGKTSLDTTLNGGSGNYTPITNQTLTAPGVRFGSIKLCDEANNCTTKTVQVSVSSKFTINYNVNGGTGSVGATTCYYGYDCNLAGTGGISRTGHNFSKWNINGTNYDAGASVKNLTIANTAFTANAQWNVRYYTVYYHVNDGVDYNKVWKTKSVKYGASVDTSLDPSNAINEYKKFNGWNDNPGTMPDHDVTLNAYINDYMCRVVTGHEKYNHVASFRGIISASGYPYSHTHIEEFGIADYYYVYTDMDMSYWRALEVFNYLWDHTPQCYCTKFLVYGKISCEHGSGMSRCRQWACGNGKSCSNC